MPLDRRRAPCGERAGGLAAREAEGARHGIGIEAAQPSHRGGAAERSDHAGTVPPFLSERRVVESQADARRHLQPRDQRGEKIGARGVVARRDRERRRDDFGRDMGQRRAVHVAHGDGGDQVAVHRRRAGERHRLPADHNALGGVAESRRQRANLAGLFAPMPGERAGKRVQQQGLRGVAHIVRNRFQLQRGREFGKLFGGFSTHTRA